MRSLIIVLVKPAVQILLERRYAFIALLTENDSEKLVQDRPVKALHETVCLGTANLGPAVFNVVQCQIQFIRAKVLEQVVQKKLSLRAAAKMMKVSYRQAKRLYRRYVEEGDQGLIHRNLGKPSGRAYAESVRTRVVALYQERYRDFGPTFAAEKLRARDGIAIDHETLRRWLRAEGVWGTQRRRASYRSRRERRACFGELLQCDGSHHDWFEGRRE